MKSILRSFARKESTAESSQRERERDLLRVEWTGESDRIEKVCPDWSIDLRRKDEYQWEWLRHFSTDDISDVQRENLWYPSNHSHDPILSKERWARLDENRDLLRFFSRSLRKSSIFFISFIFAWYFFSSSSSSLMFMSKEKHSSSVSLMFVTDHRWKRREGKILRFQCVLEIERNVSKECSTIISLFNRRTNGIRKEDLLLLLRCPPTIFTGRLDPF